MNDFPKAYAISSNDDEILFNSSSGGAFFAIASYYINVLKGSVFGATIEKTEVFHKRIDSIDCLTELMKSKYVRSDIKNTFVECENDLKKGLHVFYVGLPCQIVGLINFLNYKKIDTEKLLTADLICHGVPEKKYWDSYVKEKYTKENIISVDFRYKKPSWERFSLKIETNNGTYIKTNALDEYMRAFLKNYILCSSCYNCKFKNCNRKSNITLGDFWSVKNIHQSVYNKKGTSLVILHNNIDIMKFFKSNNIQKIDYELSISNNFAYSFSVEKPINKDIFDKIFEQYGFLKAIKSVAPITLKEKIKEKIRRILRK